MFYQFSQLYQVGKVMVLAQVAAHASRAITQAARTGSRNQEPQADDHVELNIQANFHSFIRQER